MDSSVSEAPLPACRLIRMILFSGWLHSCDLDFNDEDGEVFVVCRIKEIIDYQSDKICPADIEVVLQSYSGVKEAAVVGLPHEMDGEVPIAFFVTMPGSKIIEKKLIDLIAAELSDYKKLRGDVKFIDKLPTSKCFGKLKRKELQALAKSFVRNK